MNPCHKPIQYHRQLQETGSRRQVMELLPRLCPAGFLATHLAAARQWVLSVTSVLYQHPSDCQSRHVIPPLTSHWPIHVSVIYLGLASCTWRRWRVDTQIVPNWHECRVTTIDYTWCLPGAGCHHRWLLEWCCQGAAYLLPTSQSRDGAIQLTQQKPTLTKRSHLTESRGISGVPRPIAFQGLQPSRW